MYCSLWAFFNEKCCLLCTHVDSTAQNVTLVPRTIVLGMLALPGPEILCTDAKHKAAFKQIVRTYLNHFQIRLPT